MSTAAANGAIRTHETIGLDEILRGISCETGRLAEQCGSIQLSISTMLDRVDHPDLGAEIHMLQDIDRIQQTLADLAAILGVTPGHAGAALVLRDEIGAVIRLESLRQRLGLSGGPGGEAPAADPSGVTWL